MIYAYIIGIMLMINLGALLYKHPFFNQKSNLLRIVDKGKKINYFIYFLIHHNCYKQFISNLYKYRKINDIELWSKYFNEKFFISEAFIWNDTKEHYDYWFNLNKLWLNSIINNNFELYRIDKYDLAILIKNNKL